ncbi:MAG: hypothetical protein CME62_10740 [Halobacteriovoraceae bacterium]|nr:hypothetical protein [Halobacteriovoraceae bacterium]
MPREHRNSFNPKHQIKYGQLLEDKFLEQKKVFYTAENGLFEIEQSLEKKVFKGELTPEQADKLLTSVEYARRIILNTRKDEVNKRYEEFKEKLTAKPTLTAFYKKLESAELPGRCQLLNPKINESTQSVEFLIRGVDTKGKEVETRYSVSKDQIENGYLSTRYDSGNHLGVKQKVIINYFTTLEDESTQRFSLFENKKGEFYHAEFFHDQVYEPWFNLLGFFDFGSNTTDKQIICHEKGRYPVSLSARETSQD